MRALLIAGNWKMHMLREEGRALTGGILAGVARVAPERELLILPPFTLLAALGSQIAGSRLQLGGQDLHEQAAGAFTSGISGPMLRDTGCAYVLVGHSERRQHFGDSGVVLWNKVRAALQSGLRPVYCLGENLDQRQADRTGDVLAAQFNEALPGLSREEMAQVTLAYEPVWAIGTGRTATPEIAQEAHRLLRQRLGDGFGEEIAARVRILYGGSVKPENAAALLAQPDIDGALVGGASLQAESFLGIASAGA